MLKNFTEQFIITLNFSQKQLQLIIYCLSRSNENQKFIIFQLSKKMSIIKALMKQFKKNEEDQQIIETMKLKISSIQYSNIYHPQKMNIKNKQRFVKKIVSRLNACINNEFIVFYLSLLTEILKQQNYQIQLLEELCQINIDYAKIQQLAWFHSFIKAYTLYMNKMYNIQDILRKINNKQKVKQIQDISQIYRVKNLLDCLIPTMINTANIVERYYNGSYQNIMILIEMINSQVLKLYEYVKSIILQVFQHYRKYEYKDLDCFVKSINDMAKTLQKVEQFVMLKQIKTKFKERIKFHQIKIEEIKYYLKNQFKCSSPSKDTTFSENNSEKFDF